MATKHPYVTSNAALSGTITHLRSSFPDTVTSATLKKLGFAPGSESLVINMLNFLGIIDDDGKGIEVAKETFLLDDAAFQQGFRAFVQSSYAGLFDLHRDGAWQLQRDRLVQFFRTTDKTTALVGKRQARTFSVLCQISGYGEPKTRPPRRAKATTAKAHVANNAKEAAAVLASPTEIPAVMPEVGLTVRIELNLPADGSQETYDRIFKSIRENLLNG